MDFFVNKFVHSGFHLRAVVAAGASAPRRDGGDSGDRTFLAPFWGRAGGGVAGQSPPPLLREPDAFQPLPRGREQKMVSSRSCKWKPGGVSSAAPGFGDFPLAGAAVEAGCGAPASFGSAAKGKETAAGSSGTGTGGRPRRGGSAALRGAARVLKWERWLPCRKGSVLALSWRGEVN